MPFARFRLVVDLSILLLSTIASTKSQGQSISAQSVNVALHFLNPAAIEHIDKLITDAIAKGNCPGAVLLVGRGDFIVYQKAYGHRGLKPTTQPMNIDTVFDLASLTKPVATGISVMILYERGKIALDAPVAIYLPEFGTYGKEKITVGDLLLHVGGLIPDNDMADFAGGAEAGMKAILALRPMAKPGARFIYSDLGFITLGEIVHRVDGRTLDRFARDEIYQPLGMRETGYLPNEVVKERAAPTEMRGGQWMMGEVHDPRAHALGGVAGHAGVFSTAADLSRLCRMILRGGTLDGKRILRADTVAEMIRPRPVPGGFRTYGFDMDTAYSGPRGERFARGITFGHTGFTGTAFWIDAENDCYYILLTNSVHPKGKGDVRALRHQVGTAVAEALGIPATHPASDSKGPSAPGQAPSATRIAAPDPGRAAGPATRSWAAPLVPLAAGPGVEGRSRISAEMPGTWAGSFDKLRTGSTSHEVLCGIDVLRRDKFKQLEGRKVGLITNLTGRDRVGNRTIDLLFKADGVTLVRLFSPEHGIDGNYDEKVDNSVDAKTGLKIFSLYGTTRKPTAEMLEGIDTLVFDMQDVGTRFYTFISTMGLSMQAAAERKIRFIVLDRPNPNTGLVVDGPMADAGHLGFTAFAPLPLVHGLTVGELAEYFNGELKIDCDLQVIPLENWHRRQWWDETGLLWIHPSPNLRNPTAALLYPAIGLLEASQVSVGRGTDQPFEMFGAPWIDGRKLAAALNEAALPGLRFVPIDFEPVSSRFAHQACHGVHVQVIDRNAFEPARAGIRIVWELHHLFGEQFAIASAEPMIQNRAETGTLENAKTPEELWKIWDGPIQEFRSAREKYLIYR